MNERKPTACQLDPDERAAVAHLLERLHAAITNTDIPLGRGDIVLGLLAYATERAALDVRRGHRAEDIRQVARDLDRRIQQLITGDVLS